MTKFNCWSCLIGALILSTCAGEIWGSPFGWLTFGSILVIDAQLSAFRRRDEE